MLAQRPARLLSGGANPARTRIRRIRGRTPRPMSGRVKRGGEAPRAARRWATTRASYCSSVSTWRLPPVVVGRQARRVEHDPEHRLLVLLAPHVLGEVSPSTLTPRASPRSSGGHAWIADERGRALAGLGENALGFASHPLGAGRPHDQVGRLLRRDDSEARSRSTLRLRRTRRPIDQCARRDRRGSPRSSPRRRTRRTATRRTSKPGGRAPSPTVGVPRADQVERAELLGPRQCRPAGSQRRRGTLRRAATSTRGSRSCSAAVA